MSNESFWFGNRLSVEFAVDEAATINATREINAKTFLAPFGRRGISNIVFQSPRQFEFASRA
jgi:hypothetical protein